MKSGSICIVATQCDLCTQDEVTEKMQIMKKKVQDWFQEELSFTTKIFKPTLVRKNTFSDKNIHYFQTSSLNMEGMEDIKDFLFSEAKSSISVLPKQWADVFKKLMKRLTRTLILLLSPGTKLYLERVRLSLEIYFLTLKNHCSVYSFSMTQE